MNTSLQPAIFYHDSSPVHFCSYETSSSSPEEQVTEAENTLLANIEHLPESEQQSCKRQIRNLIAAVRSQVQVMRSLNRDSQSIRNAINQRINDFNASLGTLYGHNADYEHKKIRDTFANALQAKKIQDTTLELTPFVKKERQPAPATWADSLLEGFNSNSKPNKNLHDMEVKKTEFARCVQMSIDPESPFGAQPCLVHHSKGLTEAQKKELSDFEPNTIAGKVISEVAAVPMVVAKVINTVFKGLTLSSLSEACLTSDPTHYDENMKEARRALNGENPEFNQAIQKAMPVWMLNTRKTLAGWNQQLDLFDKGLQEKFRTVPGIVKEGVVGVADLGVIAITGPVIRGSANLIRTTYRAALAIGDPVALTSEHVYLSGLYKSTSQAKPKQFLSLDRIAVSPDHYMNRQITKRTKMTPEDIGIGSLEYLKDKGAFVHSDYHLEGWMTRKKDVFQITLESIRVPEGRLSNWLTVMSNFKKIAKANQASMLQAQIVNKKLLNVMIKRFGEPSIVLKKRYKELTEYQVFKIPVEVSLKKPFSLSGILGNASSQMRYCGRGECAGTFIRDMKEFAKVPNLISRELKRDLVLVQFHGPGTVGVDRSLNWWMLAIKANRLHTLNEVMDKAGLLSAWGKRTHVTVARIPKGEQLTSLFGKARKQIDIATGEMRPGGAIQMRIKGFKPEWIVETRKIPGTD